MPRRVSGNMASRPPSPIAAIRTPVRREALFAWRSAVWTYSTAELVKVLPANARSASVEEFMAELPAFQWPQL